MNDEDLSEWRRWSTILTERSAFEFDVADAPTADVVERKKGEWIINPTDAIDMMFTKPKCSECGFESADGGNFCSNCGADMRKEVKR